MHYDHLMQPAKPAHRSRAAAPRLPQAHRATLGQAAGWLALGWQAARAEPLFWLGLTLACADCVSLALYAPQLWILAALLTPGFVGAAAYAQGRAHAGQPASAREVCQAIGERHAALLTLGVYAIAMIVLGRAAVHGAWQLLAPQAAAGGAYRALAGALEAVPYLLVGAASWNAAALVTLRGMRPAQALLASARAAQRNWPLTLAALAAGCAASACLPLLPGLLTGLVLAPLAAGALLLATYGAYRDMFAPR